MRRVWTLVGVTAFALSARATVARAATTDEPLGGEVRSLSIVPASGRAEVVVAVDGLVKVQDFTLSAPSRVVLDLKGAHLTAAPRLYDRVSRGGITNVRLAQYRDDVVRVVIELDKDRAYKITRGGDNVRVAIDGTSETFTAWTAGAAMVADGAAADASDNAGSPAPIRVSSRRKASDAPEMPGLLPHMSAAQPRITVTYQDADIRDVIAAFAVFSGRTIVVGKGVGVMVSAEVRDQPWDVALRAILQSQGLAAKEDADGIIAVDSYQNIAAQQATEPLTTQIVTVNYARAGSLVSAVKSLLSRDCPPGATPGAAQSTAVCTPRGEVTADTATNRLIVTDVASRLQDIGSYIHDLDVRTPQVAIKAKIIFVNRTNIEDIGISYDFGSSGTFFNSLLQRPDPATFKPVDTNGDGVPDAVTGQPYNKNQQVVEIGGNSLAAVSNATQRVVQPALSLIFSTAIGKFNLTSFIDALQELRLSDVQAEPSIVTLDNKKAEILVGEETPIRVVDLGSLTTGGANQAARATVNFKETGIILSVTPHITNNRQILMTLHSERSQLQPAASDLGYTFLKQRADNELLVADGETAVIGGLTVTSVQQSKVGIPLLVDLPLLGKLFGEHRTEETKQDLLILVTPHIVDEGERLGSPSGTR